MYNWSFVLPFPQSGPFLIILVFVIMFFFLDSAAYFLFTEFKWPFFRVIETCPSSLILLVNCGKQSKAAFTGYSSQYYILSLITNVV